MFYLGADGKRIYTLKVRRRAAAPSREGVRDVLSVHRWHVAHRLTVPFVSVAGLQKVDPAGNPTKSAHPGKCMFACPSHVVQLLARAAVSQRSATPRAPQVSAPSCAAKLTQSPAPFLAPSSAARFSPDDKFSRHRVTIKKRFGQLLTQKPAVEV
jgi:rRNA maturation protein Nop10